MASIADPSHIADTDAAGGPCESVDVLIVGAELSVIGAAEGNTT